MIDTYQFKLEPTRLVLGTLPDDRAGQPLVIEPRPKPVHAIYSHGWLAMSAPMSLAQALGRARLQITRSAQVQLCANFETEQAIYQLHVATRVQLNLLE